MSSLLPSFRRQQLLIEFSTIKSKCPEGLYLSPSSTGPAIWSAVLFVRKGPYGAAVMRFNILFPSNYPDAGPAVTFLTEIFHPLLVPLTTYTFAAGALNPNTTISSSDNERLPPGAFNLRDRFPAWYTNDSDKNDVDSSSVRSRAISFASADKQYTVAAENGLPEYGTATDRPTLEAMLQYIKNAFESATLLDNLPLRAAVNPNAWHAWRAHRGLPRMAPRSGSPASAESERTPLSPGRTAGDWNWDGVWESRAGNGVDESISESSLFGSKSNKPSDKASESIRFTKTDDDTTRETQLAILRMMGLEST